MTADSSSLSWDSMMADTTPPNITSRRVVKASLAVSISSDDEIMGDTSATHPHLRATFPPAMHISIGGEVETKPSGPQGAEFPRALPWEDTLLCITNDSDESCDSYTPTEPSSSSRQTASYPGEDEEPERGKVANFDRHWIDLEPSEYASGSFGTIARAVRKITSRLYTEADKGKIYAVKRTFKKRHNDQGHHSLHHERFIHESCKRDPKWKSIRSIVWMLDYEQNVKCPSWAAFEWCDGVTACELRFVFSESVPAGLIIDVIDGVSSGLTWLHSAVGQKPRIAHRDLHASNIMLDLANRPEGRYARIKILDFGLADALLPDNDNVKGHLMEEHSDINDMAHIIHRLVHLDPRRCGKAHLPSESGGTQADQTSHCYEKPIMMDGEEWTCPHKRDPTTTLFDRDDRIFWDLLMKGCLRPHKAKYINLGKAVGMAQINERLQPYLREARKLLATQPNAAVVFEKTMLTLQKVRRAPPPLPSEHMPSAPQPAIEAPDAGGKRKHLATEMGTEDEQHPAKRVRP